MTRDPLRPLPISGVFPLLADPQWGAGRYGVSPDSDVRSLAGDSGRTSLLAVVSGLLDVGRELPVLALVPAIAAVLDESLPLERFGVRASNLLQRAGLKRWRELAPFTPSELLALPGFGETSLRDVIDVGVERSLEIVMAPEEGVDEEPGSDADWFLAGSARLEERPDLLERLAERASTIGDLVPNLASWASEDLPHDLLPTRLANRGIAKTWGELLAIPMATLLSLPNIGSRSVGALLDRVGDAARAAVDLGTRPPLDEVRELLVAIATWAEQDRSVSSLGDLIQLRPEQEPLPPDLADVWRELEEHPLPGSGPEDVIGTQIESLLSELDNRDRIVLGRRVWPAEGRWTLEQVGNDLGMTRERVRQIETTIISSLRDRLAEAQHQAIRFRAAELRHRLGSVVSVVSSRAEGAIRWSTRDVSVSNKPLARDFLLWLAGPYALNSGWWRLDEGAPDPRGNDLRDLANESGFLSDVVVGEALGGASVHADIHAEWMEAVGGFRKVDGGWLDSSGSLIDQSLRYLAFRGVPMTVEEMLEGIGRTDASTRSVRQRLFEDPRAVRVSKSEIGLPEWGHNEYTSLADEMLEELEREGGRMPLDQMVERLVDQFGVSPNSVRMYAGRPLFLLDGDGHIQVRPDDQPYEVRDDLLRVPFCYELSASEAAWRVQVDRDVLRGSGRHIPEQLAGWLRLRPGQTMTLQNSARPLALAWRSWAQPDVGSLKPFAEDLGASDGDWLVLVFGRNGTVDIRLVERSVSGTPEVAMLGRLLGLPAEPQASQKQALQALGEVLGVDTSDEDALRFRIRASLQARRDQDILELADKVLLG